VFISKMTAWGVSDQHSITFSNEVNHGDAAY